MNTLDPIVRVTSHVELAKLGYDGGWAEITINTTRAWKRSWDQSFERLEDETIEDFALRRQQRRAELLMHLIDVVDFGNGATLKIEGKEEALQLFNSDERIINLCLIEMKERAAQGYVNAAETFRRNRRASTERSELRGAANAATDDDSFDDETY